MSLVAVPASVWMVPSPQFTLMLTTDPPGSGSEAVMVRVIVWPVRAVVRSEVKLTVGGWLTGAGLTVMSNEFALPRWAVSPG